MDGQSASLETLAVSALHAQLAIGFILFLGSLCLRRAENVVRFMNYLPTYSNLAWSTLAGTLFGTLFLALRFHQPSTGRFRAQAPWH